MRFRETGLVYTIDTFALGGLGFYANPEARLEFGCPLDIQIGLSRILSEPINTRGIIRYATRAMSTSPLLYYGMQFEIPAAPVLEPIVHELQKLEQKNLLVCK